MQRYEPSITAHVVKKLLTTVMAFGTTKSFFNHYDVWMLLMSVLPDKRCFTVFHKEQNILQK
jgi:hypothetical protein